MAELSREEAFMKGMSLAVHASDRPDKLAVATNYGDRTFAELNARANQLSRLLSANGIGDGDSVAVVSKNRPAFVEVYAAALRSGIRFTPVNFHLTGEEVGYVVDNCEAKAVIYDADLGNGAEALALAPNCELKLAVGGTVEGFDDYESAIAGLGGDDIDNPIRGTQMLYTSGTTGRPKGVYRKPGAGLLQGGGGGGQQQAGGSMSAAGFNPETDRALCTGPGYHAAPLAFNITLPLAMGVGIVMMDGWDAEETLQLIEQYQITHTHMVATMFHRLLKLPEEVRAKYDVSSLRYLLHGAAPCPVHTKHEIIDWFGPIVFEYYAATEGGGGYFIDSETWLAKPGTVGRAPNPEDTLILDEEGNAVEQGGVGTIYFKAPDQGRFEYYKSPDKTAESYRGDFFTLGDMGFLDEEGWLFLTGRSAETIISGGVNVYPQEVDNEVMKHPAVLDCCTIGVPNDEWGEEVKSVVQLQPGRSASDDLADELIEFARSRLPGFKTPRSIDFADDLPRLPSGKIQRRLVREPFWEGRERQI